MEFRRVLFRSQEQVDDDAPERESDHISADLRFERHQKSGDDLDRSDDHHKRVCRYSRESRYYWRKIAGPVGQDVEVFIQTSEDRRGDKRNKQYRICLIGVIRYTG